MYYDSQVVNEECGGSYLGDKKTTYKIKRVPILPGTLKGRIYHDGVWTQTFVVNESGIFNFSEQNNVVPLAKKGTVNFNTGESILEWDKMPEDTRLVVHYEYTVK